NNRGYNDLDADALQAAVQRTDALAFNPFGYYANSPEQLALVQPDQPSGDKEIGKNWVATAKVDGKLFDWYAGQAKFALAYEHRELGYDYEPLWSSRVINYWFDGTGYVSESRKRDVDAVSGELRLPLFDGDSESFVHSAEMTAAIRYERYNDFGSSTVSQFAGKLGLLEDSILIRASYAESFLAPALADLQRQTRTVLNSNVWYDPFFNSVVPVTVIFGGNPNLRPEQGKSWNIGVVYRPRDMQGLLLTMDYWRLQIDDLIATPNIGAILLGNSLSGSLTRDPVTNLPTVDTRVANGGTRNVEGVDFQARYGWDTGVGAFNVSLGGMYFTRFEEQGNSGVTLDYLGRYSTQFGAMPELRTTFGVDWAHRGFDANVVARWMSGYTDRYGTLVNRQVGSYYTVDTQAGYEFQSDNGLLRGMRIYAGLENALDADLPFVMGSTDGWDRSLADLRGRYYYFGMSKAFK
ncbi:TonB-dependent receptor domain-containing protein, partial [Steroidobacter sp.]|uniref:TonB-dependent receptor domain-containing protein n=1 Tax=Steroidobacter sp. TaxID=1978227 RepID=UPI001A641729